MPESIPRRLEALSQTANDLVTAVNGLNDETNQRVMGVNKRLNHNKKLMWIVIISFIVDLSLTGTMAWVFHQSRETTQDVKAITKRLDYNSQVQRRKVLCPLYQLFMDSKSEQARASNPNGPAAYDKAFKVIEEGYNALNCAAPLSKGPITPAKPKS